MVHAFMNEPRLGWIKEVGYAGPYTMIDCDLLYIFFLNLAF